MAKQSLIEIHTEAMLEFDATQSAVKDERLQCLQDRRFYSIAGAQWEGRLGEQFENKPRFEVNKVHLAVIRIINEYRNNRIGIDFVSKTGEENDELADTCDGLHRADEQDSNAEEAYDNGFEEAVGGGMGAWMLHADYEDDEDEDNDYQRIKILPIFDAESSVYFGREAKRQDKADAKRCWVLRSMSLSAYKDEWNDDPQSWPKTVHQIEFDWSTPDVVYVADYYLVEHGKDTLRVFEDLQGLETKYYEADFERDPDLEARLTAIGSTEIRTKKIKKRQIHKYIMSGGKVLEDCGIIPGKCIPVVPVYGKRWYVDNIERCMGHVRLSKDAQRLKNMQTSKLAEISALSSVEKPIFTPEQVAGHRDMWTNDPIENYGYMLVNPVTGPDGMQQVAGPVSYTKVPNIPPAMAALLQITEQDIKDVLGNQQAGEQIQPNISGKVVELVQDKLDMQTYIYMSNMAKARKRSGEIWLSMQKDIYIEKDRKMKSIDSQGKAQMIKLMQPTIDKITGEVKNDNDMTRADFDIVAEVGPSSSSKRQATVRSLTGMMQITQDPETLQVLSSMVMLNMEGEGIGEVRDYFRRKLVNMGVVKPTEEEQQKLDEQRSNAKLDPNAQYLQSAAAEAEANAAEARANTVLTIAKAEKTQAETVEISATIDDMEQRQAMTVIEKFGQQPTAQPPGASTGETGK
jgi:hypothetical protein